MVRQLCDPVRGAEQAILTVEGMDRSAGFLADG